MQNFDELIALLVSGGAVAIVSWAASWGLEGWQAWNQVLPRLKQFIILMISLALGCGAVAYQIYVPEEVKAALLPFFNMAVLTVVAWLGSQVAHNRNPRR